MKGLVKALKLQSRLHVACVGGPLPLRPRDTHFLVTRGTYSHPDYPIRISPRVHMARFSYPDFLREKYTTLANITSGRPTYPIRICLSGSLTE